MAFRQPTTILEITFQPLEHSIKTPILLLSTELIDIDRINSGSIGRCFYMNYPNNNQIESQKISSNIFQLPVGVDVGIVRFTAKRLEYDANGKMRVYESHFYDQDVCVDYRGFCDSKIDSGWCIHMRRRYDGDDEDDDTHSGNMLMILSCFESKEDGKFLRPNAFNISKRFDYFYSVSEIRYQGKKMRARFIEITRKIMLLNATKAVISTEVDTKEGLEAQISECNRKLAEYQESKYQILESFETPIGAQRGFKFRRSDTKNIK